MLLKMTRPHLAAFVLGFVLGPATLAASQAPSAPKPEESNPALAQAQSLIDRGQPQQALQQLEAEPAQAGHTAGYDRIRGSALYALGRMEEAEHAFALAVAANPGDQGALQLSGLTLFRLGRPAEAIPLLERAHQWTPQTRADPSYVLALCYVDTHRYDDARRAFAAQYGFPPEGAPAHLLAGRMLLRRDYLAIAQTEAEKALALDPNLPLAHELLGEIALASSRLDDAIAEFERERERNPLEASSYDRLGDVYTRKGDYPKAQQMLERAVLLEPASTGPYILLGKALLRAGDPANAAGYLEHAETMDPANSITHTLLGQAYRAMSRPNDARRESDAAQRLQTASTPKPGAALKLEPVK